MNGRTGTQPEIVVVGSHAPALVLHVERIPRPGESVMGWDYTEPIDGGKGSNQAIAAARLGARVSFVGCVGRDRLGDLGKGYLEANGVDLRFLKRSTTTATLGGFVIVGADGVPAIVSTLGANGDLTKADVDDAVETLAREGAWVLLTQGEIRPEVSLHALKRGRDLGFVTIHNPAPVPITGLQGLEYASILTPNESEALALLGRAVDERLPGESLAAALLARSGAGSVVVTLGADGFAAADAEGTWSAPAPKANVLDTTGAGDAFNGALAATLLRGQPVRSAATWACLAASYSVAHEGTIEHYPTWEQLAEFAARKGSTHPDRDRRNR